MDTTTGTLTGTPVRTLVILKPEVLEDRLLGGVFKYFDRDDFKSIAMVQRTGSEYHFREHYKDVLARVGNEIGDDIIRRMTRGDCIFIIYEGVTEGVDIIERIRTMVGATDPAKALPGTIRHKYGTAVQYNVIHASDSAESAEREIALWFPGHARSRSIELTDYKPLYYTGC